jgi:hypothetical protein
MNYGTTYFAMAASYKHKNVCEIDRRDPYYIKLYKTCSKLVTFGLDKYTQS